MAKRKNLILAVVLVAGAFSVAAQSPDTVLNGMSYFSAAPRQVIGAELQSHENAEGDRPRELVIYIQRENAELKILATVTSPSFLRNLKFLRTGIGDNSGSWIKTSRGVRRLGTGTNAEQLFQSDFTSADFNLTNLTWTHAETFDDAGRYCYETRRGLDFGTAYARVFLRKADGLISRCEYFDASGKAVRVYEVTAWSSGPGEPGPATIRLDDFKKHSYSTIEVKKIDRDASFSTGLFSPGAM